MTAKVAFQNSLMLRKTLLSLVGIALLSFSVVVFRFNINGEGVYLYTPELCNLPDIQCAPPLGFDKYSITFFPEMSLRSSQAITIDTVLYFWNNQCPQKTNESIRYEAELLAPGFDVEPSSTQQGHDQNIDSANPFISRKEWVWVVRPTDVGTYELAFKTSAYYDNCEIGSASQTFKVTIVNLFGLNALQSNVLGIVSGFLGSALTLPGILVIWQNLNKSKVNKARDIEQDERASLIVSHKGDEKKIKIKK